MHAGKSRDEPENSVVGSSHAVEEIKDRKSDRDENTLKCAEGKDCDCRAERQGEFSPAEPPIRRNSATSTRRTAAYTTTAPNAALGNAARTGPKKMTARTTEPTATIEYSWLRLPIASPIAVRLPLLLTGKP